MRCRTSRRAISERYETADHRGLFRQFRRFRRLGSYLEVWPLLERKRRSGKRGRRCNATLRSYWPVNAACPLPGGSRAASLPCSPRHQVRDFALSTDGARRAIASPMRDQAAGGEVIIGVDVGASSIAGGLVTPDGEVLTHVQRRTRDGAGGDAVERLLDVVAAIHAEAGQRGLAVQGVGVGLPSIVDVERGRMVSTQNFVPEFADVPIGRPDRRADGADDVRGQRRQCPGAGRAAVGSRARASRRW